MEGHPGILDVIHVDVSAPALLAQLHDGAQVLAGDHDGGVHNGFLHLLNLRRVRQVGGIVHPDLGAVGLDDLVDDAGRRGHQVQVEFPFQPFLDDLHVKQAQEAAAEAEAQSHRGFRLVEQGGVVELELAQGVLQVLVPGAVRRIDAAVHHGGHLLVPRQGGIRRPGLFRDGIPHPGVADGLDAGTDVAHVTGGQLRSGDQGVFEKAHFLHLEVLASSHHVDLHAPADLAVHHPHRDDNPPVLVVIGVEDQGLQRGLGISLRRRHVGHDVLQHLVDVDVRLGGNQGRVLGVQADDVFNLLLDQVRLGANQIDLVDHRQDFQVIVQRQIHVGDGLGLDALGGIHHQHRPFTGGQAPGHLVVEVHVPRGVDEV